MCLGTITGLRLSIQHLPLQDSASTCLSVRSLPCILANIWSSSGHLKWAQDNVINHVWMSSCFTIAITSRMNLFPVWSVVLLVLPLKYAWSSQIRFTNLLGLALNWEAVTDCLWTFFRAILILSVTFFCSIMNCAKKGIQDLWQTFHCNMLESGIKVLHWWNYLSSWWVLMSAFRKQYWKC